MVSQPLKKNKLKRGIFYNFGKYLYNDEYCLFDMNKIIKLECLSYYWFINLVIPKQDIVPLKDF
jgi:hypothetical protein